MCMAAACVGGNHCYIRNRRGFSEGRRQFRWNAFVCFAVLLCWRGFVLDLVRCCCDYTCACWSFKRRQICLSWKLTAISVKVPLSMSLSVWYCTGKSKFRMKQTFSACTVTTFFFLPLSSSTSSVSLFLSPSSSFLHARIFTQTQGWHVVCSCLTGSPPTHWLSDSLIAVYDSSHCWYQCIWHGLWLKRFSFSRMWSRSQVHELTYLVVGHHDGFMKLREIFLIIYQQTSFIHELRYPCPKLSYRPEFERTDEGVQKKDVLKIFGGMLLLRTGRILEVLVPAGCMLTVEQAFTCSIISRDCWTA